MTKNQPIRNLASTIPSSLFALLNSRAGLEGDETDEIDHFRMTAQGLHGIAHFKNKRNV